MKVFVTGATGYIGFNVALAMRHAGHEVWGLAGTPERAARLVRHEMSAVGYQGKVEFTPLTEARKTLGDFADRLALDQHADAGKAARLLGFRTKHPGFTVEAETYFQAWKAWQELK